jgi:hypothetical protein
MKLQDISIKTHGMYSDTLTKYMQSVNAIYEGLIWSQPVGFTIGKLKEQFPNCKYVYNHEPMNDTYKFNIIIPYKITTIQFKQLLILVNNLGWYFSRHYIDPTIDIQYDEAKYNEEYVINRIQQNNIQCIELTTEPKYDIQIIKIPDILYHATLTSKISKIKKIGLVPKSTNTFLSFPERIYLSNNLDNLEHKLIPHMAEFLDEKNWSILTVSTGGIHIPKLKLFKDPSYPYGYYTLTNIRPEFLKNLKQITL